ncbi:hypothetical protein EDB81DRAFT_769744 [Dactylonectria macrodidyma]|uniref:Uncharacterized protein n=1 Tax=Dactylonectria macrodidyma TaxID=307937 RepID=A0A9P9FQQ6_9HYPO|nr:hypothetical protein EDB81DRAFT_769744 [Dactylonectria macrodidyma]
MFFYSALYFRNQQSFKMAASTTTSGPSNPESGTKMPSFPPYFDLSKTRHGRDAAENSIYNFINSSDETLTKDGYSGCPFIDEQLDDHLIWAVQYLRWTRSKMSELAYPLSTTEISDMVTDARTVYRKMSFLVRRHFDAKEEGIRLHRDREVGALGKQNVLVKCLTKNVLDVCEKARLARNTHKLNKRLQLLEDSVNKVEAHRIILLLEDKHPVSY